ncbi:39S ribosomal protein L44, mitochondrial [Belonocnema kinseyi]|uniref:39S ribosomal protein L44, mitochondrial n=1 Tax=Belonocnema kinseyi TaxID=2817044 RepID=UPI00143DEDCF|nr:39S ribosomal protein L44, mitochondrial [Belonocnema kinseyi]XP_033216053.1 39S ribosomal protein L44, mitochondrial [Belonocnema kinseyi]
MNALRNCTRLLVNIPKLNLVNYTAHRGIKRSIRPVLFELTRRKRAEKNKRPVIRSNFLEWNRGAELYAFNVRLSEKFDEDILEQALTHRSYVIQEEEKQKKVGIENPEIELLDNRELITDGQKILPRIVESYLSKSLPYAPQDCILVLRDYLLSTKMLASVTTGIGLKDLVLSSEYPLTDETLARTFYAVVSALIQSADVHHASLFVRDMLIVVLAEKDLLEIWCPADPLNILNEILEREGQELVEPRIIGQTGIRTIQPVFQVGLYTNKKFISSAFGETIEEAQKAAALKALSQMFGLSDSSRPLNFNLEVKDPVQNVPLKSWRRSNS